MTFDHFWQALLSAAAIVLGWFHVARRDEIKDIKAAIGKAQKCAEEAATRAENAMSAANRIAGDAAKSLAEHRLYAAENFARRAEVKEELREIEERIMKRLETAIETLEEIRDRLPPRH